MDKYIAAVIPKGILEIWGCSRWRQEPTATYQLPAAYRSVQIMQAFPSGNYFLLVTTSGDIVAFSRMSGNSQKMFNCSGATAMVLSHDGRVIVIGDRYGAVRVWELPEATSTGATLIPFDPAYTLKQHMGPITCLAFEEDDQTFLSGSTDQLMYRMQTDTGRVLQCCEGHNSEITCCATTAGLGVVTGSGLREGMAKLWNLETGAELQSSIPYKEGLQSIALDMTNGIVYLGTKTGTISKWDLSINRIILERVVEFAVPVNHLWTPPNGKMLIAGFVNGRISMIDTETLIATAGCKTSGSIIGMEVFDAAPGSVTSAVLNS